MAGAADVEAGKAYVTLYLRRVKYDQQLDQVHRDSANTQDGPPRASRVASTEEAGISIPTDLAKSAASGAAMRAGGVALARLVPMFRETAAVAPVAATAVASTGTAAAGASTGFAALAATLTPIIVPLAAIVAAAGAVYIAFFKWDELPFVVKALLVPLWPLVFVAKAAALAFNTLALAVKVLLAPFYLAAKAVGLLYAGLMLIPSAIAAIPGLMYDVAAAGWEMAKSLASAAMTMAKKVVSAVAEAAAALARLPGKLAGYAADAISGVAGAVKDVGMGIAKIGAVAAGVAAAIVGPMTLAGKEWSAYGEKIRGIQNDLKKFKLSAEEASVLARVADQTGESIETLAMQMRDGTRDFSRWKADVQASGMMMSGPGLAGALALSRAYYSLTASLSGLKNAIGEAIGPVLAESTELVTGVVRGVIRWINANQPLVAQVFRIATGVATAAAAITTLGGVIAGAGALLTPFTAALAAIAGGLAIVEVRTGAGRSIWAAYGDSVRRVWSTVTEYLGRMMAFASKVIGGVKDALMAGDLSAAVNVMWSAAKVAWVAALSEIDSITGGMIGGILRSLAAGRWADAGEAAMNAMQRAWISGLGLLSSLWDGVVSAADTAWSALQQGFDVAMGSMKKTLSSMFNTLKQWGADFLGWMANSVILPLAKSTAEYSSQAAEPIFSAAMKVGAMRTELTDSIKSPEQMAADAQETDWQTEVDRAKRSDALAGRNAGRASAADEARLAREKEIEQLRKRQNELAAMGALASNLDKTANQTALDKAIAAAKAARDAADANKPKEKDFAVSSATQSITRFSGAALGLSVGRADDPAKTTAKLSAEQLKELRKLSNELGLTMRAILELQALGGFA